MRQSTPDQLVNNPESRRRQYALATRAQLLGWENVIVIDDDLGRSGGGTARPGFERLLTAICTGSAGAVLAVEASRLARNGRDWHTLLEFCTLVNSLIIDEDGVYDPKLTNDRLLLGMKGTFSELELTILRQRSQEALRLKAVRGDLHTSVAVGYVRSSDDRLELDPDRRVREALHLAFRKFAEFGSVRQVAIWLCDNGIKMPIVVYGPRGRMVEWRLPRYNTIHRLLTNPIYAGAYVFGRTGSQVRIEAGRKLVTRNVRRTQKDWEVLIRDHHDGYISWQDYENNQRTINGNANMKGAMVPGSVRNGGGLLVGLLRCGRCGRKLKVQHNGLRGVARYLCNDASVNHGRRTKCIAFGNVRIDAAVSAEVLSVIAPLGLDAALQAIADRERAGRERLQHIELALEQARYEAARAHRQYDAVDPENRLVAGDLERRWNERLAEVARLEDDLRIARDKQPPTLTDAERAEILGLGTDVERLWSHPAASAATRKRILRAVLEEIIVTVEPRILHLKLHWKGGDHTALEVVKNRAGQHRWKTDASTEQLICDLARLLPDGSIASVLNRLGTRTAKGNTWTQQRVCVFRNDHNIPVYRDGERAERGELILHEAASRLGLSKMTVVRLIKDGILPAKQSCVGAPYVIREIDLNRQEVRHAVTNGRAVSQDPRQRSFDYQ
ncbi:excisionase family DNA binding protein [Bradyrhizobium sp. USDA 4524]|uniref:recombinase family protein n=1 Tax=unclassified Bradyrhizobium TaxID=2631580 RepID=UPI00209F43B3|nr:MULTISPECIES: recombinase family protein [unclassified Bradyrhizobium]MCP1845885.1 excisionase family DNA binding protein [Bradyrhizobium sp. USDA 4538]MCP1907482.1 excisionase family DNA binding protein [Bradyrhizobium sp. USDA 4537]MCP1985268.1 excisionase family DNA binding protein [Bradyrhizobium sp. USDA 4539]